MANTQYKGNSNSGFYPLSSVFPPYVTLSNATSSYETHSLEAIDVINHDSCSQDDESTAFSSNAAEVDETEVREDTIDDSTESDSDSSCTITQRLDAIIPRHEIELYEAAITNHLCDCACHHRDSDEEEAGPPIEEILTPLEPWNAEGALDTYPVSLRPDPSDLSPCQNCSCHITM
jgi:hypothetical protein